MTTTETPTTELCTLYAMQNKDIKALEADLEKAKKERDKQEVQLLERFKEEGIKSIRTNEGLVYLHSQIWASCSDPAVLRGTGWQWMVKGSVNSNTLSAQVRELPATELGEPILPEEVKGCINVTEKFSVRVRGG